MVKIGKNMFVQNKIPKIFILRPVNVDISAMDFEK